MVQVTRFVRGLVSFCSDVALCMGFLKIGDDGKSQLKKCMADLPEETIVIIFTLQRRLLKIINEATRFSFIIFDGFGETEETRPELDELQNIRERATSYYIKLYRLSLQVFEAQPTATSATLDLLARSITQTQAIADAGEASNQEVKRNWNLS